MAAYAAITYGIIIVPVLVETPVVTVTFANITGSLGNAGVITTE